MTDRVPTLSRGMLYKGLSTTWMVGMGMVTSAFLARTVGKDQYGLWVLAVSFAQLPILLVQLGGRFTLTRFIPKFRREASTLQAASLVRVAIILYGIGLVLFGLAFWGGAEWMATRFFRNPDLAVILRVAVAYLVGLSLIGLIQEIFQAYEAWGIESGLTAMYSTLYLMALVIVVGYGRAGITGALWANGAAACLTAAVGVALFQRRRLIPCWPSWDQAQWREPLALALGFGAPLFVTQINTYALFWVDKLLLGRYAPLEEVTFFYIATTIINGVMLFYKIGATVLTPHVAGLDDAPAVLANKFALIFRSSFHLALLCLIAIGFLGRPFIETVYGPAFLGAVLPLYALLAVFLLRAAAHAQWMFMVNVYGKSKKVLAGSSLLTGIHVILDLAWIPVYGLWGAIAASVVAYLGYWVFALLAFTEVTRHIPYASAGKAWAGYAIAMALGMAILTLSPHAWPVALFAALAGYVGSLILAREVQPQDIVLIKRAWRGVVPVPIREET